jgi:GNAT superfamily N-acetyltransferase
MIELTPKAFAQARTSLSALTHSLDIHLSIQSILQGTTPAKIYVDDADQPEAVFIQTAHRFFIAGDAHNETFAVDVRRLFDETIYPHALENGMREFILYHAPGWEDTIEAILAGRYPIQGMREYYASTAQKKVGRNGLPEGFSLVQVDETLLNTPGLDGLDDLAEELCSERENVQDFLANSFGVCLLRGNELAGWCLSEYNTSERCEIGIETREAFRKRGFGVLMTQALVERAFSEGISQVGWHCWKSNVASGATARSAGFEKVCDYPVYFAWFNGVINLAINGNVCFSNRRYAEALGWFEKAFAAGDPPNWVYWVAACAAARLEQFDAAMRYLTQAVERGFVHADVIQSAEELRPLHSTDAWKALIDRLAQG